MRFLEIISGWVNRYFSDEEAVFLIILLLLSGLFLFMLGDSLAPVFTGLILAFLLTGLVDRLKAFKVPEPLAVGISFAFFLAALLTVAATVLFSSNLLAAPRIGQLGEPGPWWVLCPKS